VSLARTGFWFGAVGAGAALTHAAVFGLAKASMWPELANALGLSSPSASALSATAG
jgi:hypothetical protein